MTSPGATSFVCTRCGAEAPARPETLACPACGDTLELPTVPVRLDGGSLDGAGVWRYRDYLPVSDPVSLGEPTTPLVAARWAHRDVIFKLEGAQPTGSFKDRGAAVLVSWLVENGVEHVADDSSGNAGAALAAYCARAGILCDLYVPADTPPAKLAQMEAYGARLVRVPGPRSASTDAVRAASETVVYASHSRSPLYPAGTQTFAWELWEQLGRRAPDVLVAPVGGGSLLLGAHRGFLALRQAGLVERLPRIVGIQTSACAPLALAVAAGSPDPLPVEPASSSAGGILVARPERGREFLTAVAATSGTVMAVPEDDVLAAHRVLARKGFFVEPTSAVGVAGLDMLVGEGLLQSGETVVVALTGHGLKVPPAGRG